ncbi:MAG: sensor histidine kinase [Pseudomonadota bacterium]
MHRSLRQAPLVAAIGATSVTVCVAALPFVRFAYRNDSVHVALETTAAIVASVAAFLVGGRVAAEGRRGDVVLAAALVTLGATNLVFALAPELLVDETPPGFDWAALTGRLAGDALLFVAAFAPATPLARPARALRWALWSVAALVVGVAAATAAAASTLPRALPQTLPPDASTYPLFAGHQAVLAAQVVGAVLLGAAAVGFARRPAWRASTLGPWLATATVLGAAGRANYVLFPSLYSEWVYTGDAFRLAFYVTLLLAGASEVRSYWHRLAAASVAEERRRIARDLHDGLAQELAAIVRHAAELSPDDVRSAAGRALEESRRAIVALARPADEPPDVAVAVAAEEAARRCGGHVDVTVEAPADMLPAVREALVRVAGEAVSNALRHARVDRVALELRSDPVRLVVRDDGCGFDPRRVRRGFGLTGMRERVEAVGGAFAIRSAPGAGTTVEALVP